MSIDLQCNVFLNSGPISGKKCVRYIFMLALFTMKYYEKNTWEMKGKESKMEIDKVNELESKISTLIDKCVSLKEENSTLKIKVEEMRKERDELVQFKQEAIAKVDRLINTLDEVSL